MTLISSYDKPQKMFDEIINLFYIIFIRIHQKIFTDVWNNTYNPSRYSIISGNFFLVLTSNRRTEKSDFQINHSHLFQYHVFPDNHNHHHFLWLSICLGMILILGKFQCCKDHSKTSEYKYLLFWINNTPCRFLPDFCLLDD